MTPAIKGPGVFARFPWDSALELPKPIQTHCRCFIPVWKTRRGASEAWGSFGKECGARATPGALTARALPAPYQSLQATPMTRQGLGWDPILWSLLEGTELASLGSPPLSGPRLPLLTPQPVVNIPQVVPVGSGG